MIRFLSILIIFYIITVHAQATPAVIPSCSVGETRVTNSITLQTPDFYGGVQTSLTDNVDSDQASFINTAGNRTVSVNCGTLTTNQRCIITYDIEVN